MRTPARVRHLSLSQYERSREHAAVINLLASPDVCCCGGLYVVDRHLTNPLSRLSFQLTLSSCPKRHPRPATAAVAPVSRMLI